MPTVEIRKWHAAPTGLRAGFCDVAIPAWGIVLHDCAVFKKADDGTTRVSIALPNKKFGRKWLHVVSWIEPRSDLARAVERAIIDGLKAHVRAEGGGA